MKCLRLFFPLVLLAVVGACITEPEPIGTNGGSVGSFSITIQAFNNGPTNGKATFALERGDEASFSLSLLDSLGTTIVITGPGTPVVGDDREVGDVEGFVNGTVTRSTAAGTAVYVMTSGSFSVQGVSANRLVGAIEFTAEQRTGPAIGATITGKGTFSASGGNSQI